MMLFNEVGKAGYERLRSRFVPEASVRTWLEGTSSQDLTRAFDEVYTHLTPQELVCWSGSETDRAMTRAQGEYPVYDQHEEPRQTLELHPEIDWEYLRLSLPKEVAADEVLTDDVITAVKELVFLYRLDSYQMGKFLNEPYIYGDQNRIGVEDLKTIVARWYDEEVQQPIRLGSHRESEPTKSPEAKEESKNDSEKEGSAESHRRMLERISPIVLLERYQGGGKVSKSDHQMVDELLSSYRLNSGVVNVLLEYVMLTNDKQLPRTLITKIAAHWRRQGIETVGQAQEQAKALFQSRKSSKSSGTKRQRRTKSKKALPEWIVQQQQAEQEKHTGSDASSKPRAHDEAFAKKEQEVLDMLREFGDLD